MLQYTPNILYHIVKLYRTFKKKSQNIFATDFHKRERERIGEADPNPDPGCCGRVFVGALHAELQRLHPTKRKVA